VELDLMEKIDEKRAFLLKDSLENISLIIMEIDSTSKRLELINDYEDYLLLSYRLKILEQLMTELNKIISTSILHEENRKKVLN
jgi:hypothetical protein